MAEFRQIHCKIYTDEWFLDLDPDGKLLFIYLFSNEATSPAGIYKLPLKVMAFETGLDRSRIEALLGEFNAAGKVEYEDGIVWVRNMSRYQHNESPRVQVRIRRDLADLPDCPIKQRYLSECQPMDTLPQPPPQKEIPSPQSEIPSAYPIDRVSIGPEDTDTDTDTNTDTETDTKTDPLGGPNGPDFSAASESMTQKFQSLLERLRGEKNKPATLREIYCLCFGEGDAPDFGYLGKVAREVGGAGRLAELMWQLVPRPPTGDKLAYIQAQHKRTEAAAPPTRRERSQAAIKNALLGGSNGHARAGSAIIDLTGRDVSE